MSLRAEDLAELRELGIIPEEFPSLAPPGEDLSHLSFRSTGKILCGAETSSHHCKLPWTGQTVCEGCGRPVCSTCRHMADVYGRTGIEP